MSILPRSNGNPFDQHGKVPSLFSFRLGNIDISFHSPCFTILGPFSLVRYIGRNNSQIVFLRGTHYMDCTSLIAKPQHQATMSSRILGIILDDLALLDDLPNFPRAYHALRSIHLTHRMWQKQIPLFCHLAYRQDQFVMIMHRLCRANTSRLNKNLLHPLLHIIKFKNQSRLASAALCKM